MEALPSPIADLIDMARRVKMMLRGSLPRDLDVIVVLVRRGEHDADSAFSATMSEQDTRRVLRDLAAEPGQRIWTAPRAS